MGAITSMTKRFLTHWLPYTHSWLTWCLKQLYNNRCILHIKMTLWRRHAYFQIGNESIDLNFKNCIFDCAYGARVEDAIFEIKINRLITNLKICMHDDVQTSFLYVVCTYCCCSCTTCHFCFFWGAISLVLWGIKYDTEK